MIEIYGAAELACCLVLLYLGSTAYSAMEIVCVSSLWGTPRVKKCDVQFDITCGAENAM